MDGEAGWWTTSGNIGLPPLARVMGVGRQQQQHNQWYLIQAHIPPLSNWKETGYITANIPNTPMQHRYKTQHSTVTALHTLNNTVAKGFNQMDPPARTITVAFDTMNIHILIRKLLQTNIPVTIIKFITNYIKGRKAYTTYINHTSKQCQFKTGVPQGGVLSPTLFNICTSDLLPPSAPVQVMAYADNITITSTHTSTSAAKKYIQPYHIREESVSYSYWNSLFVSVFTTETLKSDFYQIYFSTPLFHNNKHYHTFAIFFDRNTIIFLNER